MSIPVTIVGGYLGAGKTSLINHLLTSSHGIRVAVLVNDFGAVNIDAALISDVADDTVSLTNGCVCCVIQDDLGSALDKQAKRSSPPDHIVIESSGVAEPGRILRYATDWPGIHRDASVTVADAESIRTRANDKFVGRLVQRQLAAADFVVLNKVDLMTTDGVAESSEWLRRLVPNARLIPASHGAVDATLLLGHPAPQATTPPDDGGHSTLIQFHSKSLAIPGAVDIERLATWLQSLPPTVHRLKGFVSDTATGQRVLVQKVGSRQTFTTPISDRGGEISGVLVAIGVSQSDLDSLTLPLVQLMRAA